MIYRVDKVTRPWRTYVQLVDAESPKKALALAKANDDDFVIEDTCEASDDHVSYAVYDDEDGGGEPLLEED